MRRPNVSRFCFRFWKCFVGLREGAIRLAIANLPTFGVFFHSWVQILVMAAFALRLALDRVVLKGIWQLREVASFASASALSFPGMSQWLGHQETVTVRLGWFSKLLRMWLWKLSVKNWADDALGSAIALTEAALSDHEKKAILLVLGKSFSRAVEMAALARAAISASNTSAWPPRPTMACSISLPSRNAAAPAPALVKPSLLILEPSVYM